MVVIFNEDGISLIFDFLSYICMIEIVKLIFKEGKILLVVKVFNKFVEVLVNDKRNVVGDFKDYFDYVMLNWLNINFGYCLVMERLLGKVLFE